MGEVAAEVAVVGARGAKGAANIFDFLSGVTHTTLRYVRRGFSCLIGLGIKFTNVIKYL